MHRLAVGVGCSWCGGIWNKHIDLLMKMKMKMKTKMRTTRTI